MGWSKDWSAAPRDGSNILVRHPAWRCPAVFMYIDADEDLPGEQGEPFWAMLDCEDRDTDFFLSDNDELLGYEWATIPE